MTLRQFQLNFGFYTMTAKSVTVTSLEIKRFIYFFKFNYHHQFCEIFTSQKSQDSQDLAITV